MMQQFPIYVDLHVVPPLIIRDAPAWRQKYACSARRRRLSMLSSIKIHNGGQNLPPIRASAGLVKWVGKLRRRR
jgi:hypothetical protein